MTKLIFTSLLFLSLTAFAEETLSEKAADAARDTKHEIKKGYHRVKEKACLKNKAECSKEKLKHRADEAGEALENKAKEIKEAVD